MTLTVDLNTYNAYQAARRDGIIIRRNFIWISAKNRSDGSDEATGLWDGPVAMTVPVRRPSDGTTDYRIFQPMQGRMKIPSIPMEMSLKVQSLGLKFSNLSPAIINAVRVYDSRKQPVEIYRGLYDPISRKVVAPAHCRWDGICTRVRITRAKAGDDGEVNLETVSHARWLTIASADKMDAHFFERRGDQAGKYISTIWRVPVPWGQDTIKHSSKPKPPEKFFK